MQDSIFEKYKDEIILVARILILLLFVIFGWKKITGFSGAVSYVATTGMPMPTLSAIFAIAVEVCLGASVIVGCYTRPLAATFVIYTLATALIGHHYWTLEADQQFASMINFYKNVSIIGGLLLLSVTGPGKYSIDRK